jgi:hypothetical protein
MTTKKYLCIRQKKNIVAEAYSKPNNIKATARAYLVQPKQIRSWKSMLDGAMVVVPAEVAEIPLQEEGVIQRQVLMKKIAHPGRSPKSAADFEGWRTLFDQLRLQDRACTTRMLSVELKRQPGNENVSLKALEKRIKRWLARKDSVIRRVTRVVQNTRLDQETIQDFVSYVNNQTAAFEFPAGNIVNIDETNINFDMFGSKTLATRGERTIGLRTTGNSNRCTVLLGVTMSGEKLPPFIVFTGTRDGRISRQLGLLDNNQQLFPVSIKYACQPKAWVDTDIFLQWIEKVWQPFALEKGGEPTHLLMDDFTVHKVGRCVDAIKNCGTEVDFVLPGYTSRLQVLDVGVNKPFKDYMRGYWEDYMVANVDNPKVQRHHIAQWVEMAWARVSIQTITNTWKSIGYEGFAAVNWSIRIGLFDNLF